MAPIEKGSLVLVTGANGYIASHIVDQLLGLGYKVRGTVRTEAKGKWLKDYADAKYGQGKFELAIVPEMGNKGAFDEAVKGASGVAHVASNLSFANDPNDVIPSVLGGVIHTLEAANKEPSVKRFVFTSSSTAASNPIPDKDFDITESTWNQYAIDKAWAPPPYTEADRGWNVYGASKTQAEQALWKFVDENKPHFEANAVLPNTNFGPILSKEQDASTAGWIRDIYSTGGIPKKLVNVPPQWFVNVRDTALLHIAALIDPEINHERIFAFSEPFNWNSILATLRKLRPDFEVQDVQDNSKDLSKITKKQRAEEILNKNFGQKHFIGLEESLKENIANL